MNPVKKIGLEKEKKFSTYPPGGFLTISRREGTKNFKICGTSLSGGKDFKHRRAGDYQKKCVT